MCYTAFRDPARGTDEREAFRSAVHEGLSRRPKAIPSTWLYDQRGSTLFEEITRTPEYYPTRTEMALLTECRVEIADLIGPDAVLVEFGSGSSRKTRLLLEALHRPGVYVPLDISRDFLLTAANDLATAFPELRVEPVVADFTRSIRLPADLPATAPKVGFFPGSTIGNFSPGEAGRFLGRIRGALGADCRLIVGVDLEKPRDILLRAYDDAAGVTAAFNLNLLRRINEELDGGFDLSSFRHDVRVEEGPFRVEMHLTSMQDQAVAVGAREFGFYDGETIHTENSHKYTASGFAALAGAAGWRVARRWIDADGLFGLFALDG